VFVCLSVYTRDIKTDAAGINTLDLEMFRDESCIETHLFRSQKLKDQGQESPKSIAGVGFALL